jgi:hypothetical protein
MAILTGIIYGKDDANFIYPKFQNKPTIDFCSEIAIKHLVSQAIERIEYANKTVCKKMKQGNFELVFQYKTKGKDSIIQTFTFKVPADICENTICGWISMDHSGLIIVN